MAIDRSKAIHKKVNFSAKELSEMAKEWGKLKYDAPNNTKRNGVKKSTSKKVSKKK